MTDRLSTFSGMGTHTIARAGHPAISANLVLCRLVLAVLLSAATSSFAQINPPIGPHTSPQADELARATVFGTNDPVVLTSYFYWYDIYSNAHILNPDGSDALTTHPPTLTGFSYRSPLWHQRQLEDMMDAGIDVLLPVYWGEPSQRIPGKPVADQPWSFAGLPPLVKAREELLNTGLTPPAIGMFYDTSTLEYNAAGTRVDLTTDEGRRWFYESIRDFFSLIPAQHWATIEGKPIIFLYSAGFAAAHDQSCIEYVRAEFARDFSGREPYIVREISWNVRADNTYAWGGAVSLRNPGVAALGPGYDHSAVPGRDPLIVPREDGAFFERNWIRFLRAPSRLVHIETWNEYHEGTDISASKEYGRKYIELNGKYAGMFKAGIKPPRPQGPYSDVKSVSVALQATNQSRGLMQFDFADGMTVSAEIDGKPCRAVAPTTHLGRYIYFQIDDSFKWADKMLVDVEIEYFDQGTGTFLIEYDGPDPNAPFNGAYTSTKSTVTLGDSGKWKTAKLRLVDARFLNSQNGGADFRIAVLSAELHVRQVIVRRLGLPNESGASLRGWQQDFAEPPSSNWVTVGTAGVFQQANGILKTGPAKEGPEMLVAPVTGATPLEVLARVRLLTAEASPNWLGGIVLAPDSASGNSFAALFRRDTGGHSGFGIIASGDAFGPFQPTSWTTNRWYWLRLRHQPSSLSGAPDLFARLWPADGETPEPDAWTTWRDYYPAAPAAAAQPGIIAGQGIMEVDWMLVKSDALPEIVAQPPPLKAAYAKLVPIAFSPAEGMRIKLYGDPDIEYVVEASDDMLTWSGSALSTGAGGVAMFEDALPHQQRFYRARWVR